MGGSRAAEEAAKANPRHELAPTVASSPFMLHHRTGSHVGVCRGSCNCSPAAIASVLQVCSLIMQSSVLSIDSRVDLSGIDCEPRHARNECPIRLMCMLIVLLVSLANTMVDSSDRLTWRHITETSGILG